MSPHRNTVGATGQVGQAPTRLHVRGALTLVTGPGAVARNSIGITLVGGMTIGTIFTLFVVPSVYVLIARQHRLPQQGTVPDSDLSL